MTLIDLLELSSPRAASLPDGAAGLIALGAIEQHGPHLPLGTDALLARELAERIAERSRSPMVLAPVLCVGLSQHHLSFAGTVTLDETTLTAHLDALVGGYGRIGVKRVFIFSAHGGNFGFLGRYERERPQVAGFSDLRRYFAVAASAAARAGLAVSKTDQHAGVIETSQALAVFPALVARHAAAPGLIEPSEDWEATMFRDGLESVSPNGVLGDPQTATATAGGCINRALVEMFGGWIEERLANCSRC